MYWKQCLSHSHDLNKRRLGNKIHNSLPLLKNQTGSLKRFRKRWTIVHLHIVISTFNVRNKTRSMGEVNKYPITINFWEGKKLHIFVRFLYLGTYLWFLSQSLWKSKKGINYWHHLHFCLLNLKFCIVNNHDMSV